MTDNGSPQLLEEEAAEPDLYAHGQEELNLELGRIGNNVSID